MSPAPLVSCRDCGFAWNSAAMAEGLRLLGACPRCHGRLDFSPQDQPREQRFEPAPERGDVAPHLVLGIPRR